LPYNPTCHLQKRRTRVWKEFQPFSFCAARKRKRYSGCTINYLLFLCFLTCRSAVCLTDCVASAGVVVYLSREQRPSSFQCMVFLLQGTARHAITYWQPTRCIRYTSICSRPCMYRTMALSLFTILSWFWSPFLFTSGTFVIFPFLRELTIPPCSFYL